MRSLKKFFFALTKADLVFYFILWPFYFPLIYFQTPLKQVEDSVYRQMNSTGSRTAECLCDAAFHQVLWPG